MLSRPRAVRDDVQRRGLAIASSCGALMRMRAIRRSDVGAATTSEAACTSVLAAGRHEGLQAAAAGRARISSSDRPTALPYRGLATVLAAGRRSRLDPARPWSRCSPRTARWRRTRPLWCEIRLAFRSTRVDRSTRTASARWNATAASSSPTGVRQIRGSAGRSRARTSETPDRAAGRYMTRAAHCRGHEGNGGGRCDTPLGGDRQCGRRCASRVRAARESPSADPRARAVLVIDDGGNG